MLSGMSQTERKIPHNTHSHLYVESKKSNTQKQRILKGGYQGQGGKGNGKMVKEHKALVM